MGSASLGIGQLVEIRPSSYSVPFQPGETECLDDNRRIAR